METILRCLLVLISISYAHVQCQSYRGVSQSTITGGKEQPHGLNLLKNMINIRKIKASFAFKEVLHHFSSSWTYILWENFHRKHSVKYIYLSKLSDSQLVTFPPKHLTLASCFCLILSSPFGLPLKI